MRRAVIFLFLLCATVIASATDYGAAPPAKSASTPLAAALVKADFENDQVITGRVGRVCQKQGCWMMLIDGETTARVMTGHRFFLPADATGEAIVYGRLIEREVDRKTAKHFARESGGEPVATGREYRIDALGMQIRP